MDSSTPEQTYIKSNKKTVIKFKIKQGGRL
jgi:hypothetical protein